MTSGRALREELQPSVLLSILPDAKLLSVKSEQLIAIIESNASPKEIFDAERLLRKITGMKWELMMGRKQDENKLRVKLAKFRGVGDAT